MMPLKQIRVETPCGADWEEMTGTGKVRFCAGCRKEVHNLSAMTRAEARETLAQAAGTPCVRFHHDADGAPLTREGMPGRRRFLGHLAGALLALVGLALPRTDAAAPGPPTQKPPARPAVMGDIAMPPPPWRPLMGKIGPPPHPSHGPGTKGKNRKG